MTETVILGIVGSVLAAPVIRMMQRLWARWRASRALAPGEVSRGVGLDALAEEGAQRLLAQAMRREIEKREQRS